MIERRRKLWVDESGRYVSRRHPRIAKFFNAMADVGNWMIRKHFVWWFLGGLAIIIVLLYFLT